MARNGNKKCVIGVLGCGTVGGATARMLLRDRDYIRNRTGIDLELRYVIDQKFDHARKIGIPEKLYTTELDKALADSELSVIVELVGGTTVAKELSKKALSAGKHVVTANKALLAHHGAELFALARQNDVCMGFEASCGGGIPIIRALYDGLIANRVDALFGIVNGTCNYILTQMIQNGQSYADALRGAQADGLAEADPTLDVAGIDSAHKIAIMAAIAFGKRFPFDDIPVEGIDKLDIDDVKYGMDLGYVIKLLAIAQRVGSGYCLRVRPVFISHDHPLSWVSGPFNAVSVYGHATGHTMYYGRGAGGSPTASAVVADIVGIAAGTLQATFNYPGIYPDTAESVPLVPPAEIVSRYYTRLMLDDSPGSLARITAILGKHGISISSVLQEEPPDPRVDDDPDRAVEGRFESPENGSKNGPKFVPVIITVHPAQEKAMMAAMAEIDALPAVQGKSSILSIIDEHPENLLH